MRLNIGASRRSHVMLRDGAGPHEIERTAKQSPSTGSDVLAVLAERSDDLNHFAVLKARTGLPKAEKV